MTVRSLSIANILQRRWPALLVCLGLLAGAGLGQMRKPKSKTPRALALVEWPTSGPPRLVPITIQIDGRLYDAGIYKASPVPMALEYGNVYEVEQSGASVGFFTVYDAKEVKDNWYGEGQWQSAETMEAQRKAAAASEAAAAEARVRAKEDADKPPVLRRGGSPNSQPESAPPATAPPSGPPPQRGPDEPPVLRRPSAPAPSATESAPAPAPAPSTAAPAASSSGGDDSGRPVLRRGAPRGGSQAASLPGSVVVPSGAQATSVPSTAARVANKGTSGAVTRVLPAISDAGGPEPRSYLFELSPAEEQRLSGLAKAMAFAELGNYAKGHPAEPRPGPLQDAQMRSFDLAYTNSPLLVLTARAGAAPAEAPASRSVRRGARRGGAAEALPQPAPQATPVPADFSYYVTVVAREDINGDLRRLFVSTTDSNHLDAFSRLELIDAVDADGDGRGELLFRAISDSGSSFVIYRAGPDNLTTLFNSAELER